MSAKCSSYMYGTPYIFHFVHPLVKTAEIMVQRVNFERNLKNIRPPTVLSLVQILSETEDNRQNPSQEEGSQSQNRCSEGSTD